MFSVHTDLARKISKRNNHVSFWICVWGELRQGKHMIIAASSISAENAPFSKCFPSTLKRKTSVFKFLWFEERFRKAPLSWQISVDGRPNRRNKDAFSNSSGLKSVFEKLRFRDRSVWTVGLTVEIKLRCRDRSVWTVGLTLEIKLGFQIPPVWRAFSKSSAVVTDQCGR